LKVAIIHYWLVGMRGGEKVVEALCRLFPTADIYTHVYRPDAVSETIRHHDVRTTFINSLPRATGWYKKYLPLMPLALEQLDLRGYDIVISSESGPAKGVLPPANSVHVCYCHTPMRYLWNMYHDYRERSGAATRALMPPLAHYLRMWDLTTASRVDDFVANSSTVAARIRRYYRRDATVIHPPVEVDAFKIVSGEELGNYYLMVGELVAYKRPDLAVQAFNKTGQNLVIIGGGEMLDEIRRLAGPTIRVLGPQPFHVLREHYARCRALIFPGEEDFGIVPVEAMASGRPVVAYARGGATETIIPGQTGVLFEEQSVEAIVEAVREADGELFSPQLIATHAKRFSTAVFELRMRNHIDGLLARHDRGRLDPSENSTPGSVQSPNSDRVMRVDNAAGLR
jgi:glycosyltransferase involved in cell wall biosynthesis